MYTYEKIFKELERKIFNLIKQSETIATDKLNYYFDDSISFINYLFLNTLKTKYPFIFQNLDWNNFDGITLYFTLKIDSILQLEEYLNILGMKDIIQNLSDTDIANMDNYFKTKSSIIKIEVCKFYNEI